MIQKRIATLGVAFDSPDPAILTLLGALTDAFQDFEGEPDITYTIEPAENGRHRLLKWEYEGPAEPPPNIFPTFQHNLMLHLARTDSHIFLHTAALEREGRALLMAGDSEAGKTTLSTALLAEGFRFLTDDLAPVLLEHNTVEPCPYPLRLREEAIRRLGPLDDRVEWIGEPFEHRGQLSQHALPRPAYQAPHQAWPVALIVFPEWVEQGPPRLERLSAGQAAFRLMGSVINGQALLERGFEGVAALASAAPCYDLQTSDYRDAVHHILEAWSAL